MMILKTIGIIYLVVFLIAVFLHIYEGGVPTSEMKRRIIANAKRKPKVANEIKG